MSARWYLRQALSVCVTLILRLHLLLTSRALAQVGMCSIRSGDNKESQGSLTCYLPENVNHTKANFIVYHNTSNGNTETAVSCGWTRDNIQCSTARGYEFEGDVTDHLTVRISRLESINTGTCSCHITGVQPVHHKKAPVNSSCHFPRDLEKDPPSLTCTFSVDVNVTRTNFTVVHVGTGHTNGTEIVSCFWVSNDLSCSTHPGYELSSSVNHHVIIRVTPASRDRAGTYACHVPGSRTDGFESCGFIPLTCEHLIVIL